MKPIYLPPLHELAENCDEPRVHPNGFIQLDLNATHRLHVWHPNLPYRQKTFHPIHDHVFGFTSQIFSGRITNVTFDVLERTPTYGGTHYMAQAECIDPVKTESILVAVPDQKLYAIEPVNHETLMCGDQYEHKPFRFHEILFNEPSLTIIRKFGKTIYQGNPDKPTVMVPRGVTPDNSFRRGSVSTDLLWELIAEAHPS